MSDPAPPKYPYEVVNGGVMVRPSKLFALNEEPAWKDATVRDTMAEYMRRAAEERGEDAEQLDSSQPLQLCTTLPGKTPEEMNTILAQLQAMGLTATVTLEPAPLEQQARQLCDGICAVAEGIAERSQDPHALGPLLDKLNAVRNELISLRQAIREQGESSNEREVLLTKLIVVREKLYSLAQTISQ
jgi:hypothetical protein